jgi:hypothetical protein
VRTLFEIIDGAKDGNKPTHDECYFAMLALANLLAMDHKDLRDVCADPKPVRCNLTINGSFNRYKRALDTDPQVWLGNHVPGNPDYDRFRAFGKKLMEDVEAKGEEKGK